MIKFDKEKVLLLNQIMAEATGGSIGVRDEALLESALENCFATFDGKELYPTKEEKAARLGSSLVSNHAFVDGNKRIGVYIMLSFLEINGIKIFATNDDIAHVGLSLADGSMKYEDLLEWIIIHRNVARAKELWGETEAYKEFEEKTKDGIDEGKIKDEFMSIFAEFGKLKDLDPADKAVQLQVRKLQDYISAHFYKCTNEILKGLGNMYVNDPEFSKNIDESGGTGTVKFVSKAINIYCK